MIVARPTTDATAADAETADQAAKPKKVPTRAQAAREATALARAEQDKATVAGAPTFSVVYPTGISVFVPDADEIEVHRPGGGTEWVDVIGQHAHIPAESRIRPGSVTQLEDFNRLAAQGFLQQVLPA